MGMTLEERLESLLKSPEPAKAFRSWVLEQTKQGLTKARIYESLEQFLLHLRSVPESSEVDEDIVLDVMDSLTGWCHPESELLPDR
jgi:hypothetical protein